MPRPRPPSDPARPLPTETIRRPRCAVAAFESTAPGRWRGRASRREEAPGFRSRPGTRRPGRRRQPSAARSFRGGTGDMNRASPPDNPRPPERAVRAGGTANERRGGRHPDLPEYGASAGTGGGGVRGTIDSSCEPDPLPLAPPSTRRPVFDRRPGRENRARYARFFSAPLCGATTKTPAGKGPPRTPGKGERDERRGGLDSRQAPARAELLLAADFGREARGHPTHGRIESKGGSRRAKAPGSAYGNPLGGHAGHRPGRAHRSVLDREDRRPRCARVARLPGGASDHAVARRPGEPGAERPGEVPVAGGPAALAASPSRAKAAAHDAPHREPRRPAVDAGRLPVVGHRCRVAAGRPA